jgi:thioredoxin 1
MSDVEVLMFTQETCSACAEQRDEYGDVASDHPDVTVREVDIQRNLATAEEYGVRKTPTTLVYRDDERVAEFLGVASRAELDDAIERARSGGGLVDRVRSFLGGD